MDKSPQGKIEVNQPMNQQMYQPMNQPVSQMKKPDPVVAETRKSEFDIQKFDPLSDIRKQEQRKDIHSSPEEVKTNQVNYDSTKSVKYTVKAVWLA